MKNTKYIILMVLLVSVLLLGSACTRKTKYLEEVPKTEQPTPVATVQTEEPTVEPTVQPEETPEPTEAVKNQEDSKTDFSFADVSDLEFVFTSGAGAWCTALYINEDGTFEGTYHDSDMGDIGDGYPNGTQYLCDFSGKFTSPVKVDATSYVFEIESIEYAHEFGEEIKDEIKYVYTEAHGLNNSDKIYMYLPGAVIVELPEEYRSWVGHAYLYKVYNVEETNLPFYGLYNENAAQGFFSYEKETPAEELDNMITSAEWRADEYEEILFNTSNVTQAELNEAAANLYEVWDNLINEEWAMLKENLDSATMAKVKEEQLDWISYKEQAAKDAGAEVEGGSMYSMLVNHAAAELTKDRVYELAEYLK